eukprot:Gb_40900 [translate_table: standard]
MASAGNHASGFDTEKYGAQRDIPVKWRKAEECVLRSLGFVFTLAASVILGTNKQTVSVLGIKLSAVYHDNPTFVYFVVANAIGCAYLFFSLFLSNFYMSKRGSTFRSIRRFLFLVDLMMFGLILSAASSAITVGYIGYKGNSDAHWNSTCDVVGKFCRQGIGAAAASFLGVLTFIPLIVLPAYEYIN